MQNKDVGCPLEHGDDSRIQHGTNTPVKQFDCPIYNRMRSHPPDTHRHIPDADNALNQNSSFEHHNALPPPYTSRRNSSEIVGAFTGDSKHCDSSQSQNSDFSTDLCPNIFINVPSSGDTPKIPRQADPSCLDLRIGTVTTMRRPTMMRVVSSDLTSPTEVEFVTDAGLSRLKISLETSGKVPKRHRR